MGIARELVPKQIVRLLRVAAVGKKADLAPGLEDLISGSDSVRRSIPGSASIITNLTAETRGTRS